MAAGTAVAASRSAGKAAIILDKGHHGLLCDPHDAQGMASAIARQLDSVAAVRPGDGAARFAMADSLAALGSLDW